MRKWKHMSNSYLKTALILLFLIFFLLFLNQIIGLILNAPSIKHNHPQGKTATRFDVFWSYFGLYFGLPTNLLNLPPETQNSLNYNIYVIANVIYILLELSVLLLIIFGINDLKSKSIKATGILGLITISILAINNIEVIFRSRVPVGPNIAIFLVIIILCITIILFTYIANNKDAKKVNVKEAVTMNHYQSEVQND